MSADMKGQHGSSSEGKEIKIDRGKQISVGLSIGLNLLCSSIMLGYVDLSFHNQFHTTTLMILPNTNSTQNFHPMFEINLI